MAGRQPGAGLYDRHTPDRDLFRGGSVCRVPQLEALFLACYRPAGTHVCAGASGTDGAHGLPIFPLGRRPFVPSLAVAVSAPPIQPQPGPAHMEHGDVRGYRGEIWSLGGGALLVDLARVHHCGAHRACAMRRGGCRLPIRCCSAPGSCSSSPVARWNLPIVTLPLFPIYLVLADELPTIRYRAWLTAATVLMAFLLCAFVMNNMFTG